MKKILLCLLAIGIIAGAFAIGKNWNKITNTDTPPTQNEVVEDENNENGEIALPGDKPGEDIIGGDDILDSPDLTFIIGG